MFMGFGFGFSGLGSSGFEGLGCKELRLSGFTGLGLWSLSVHGFRVRVQGEGLMGYLGPKSM